MSTEFGKRLRAARMAAGLSQVELAKRVQLSQSTIAAAERTGHGSRQTPQIAHALGVDAHWLATGDGTNDKPAKAQAAQYPTLMTGHPLVAREKGPQAHQLSDISSIVTPTLMSWDDLMRQPLPKTFLLELGDDAMSPEFPSGSRVVFSTEEGKPRAGDAVLLMDRDGNTFFRVFRPRTPEHWAAAPLNEDHQTLDSRSDGLTVLAVKVGSWGRRG